ncbi:Mpv17/PMP22, partial [Lipomyces tetrasporus]
FIGYMSLLQDGDIEKAFANIGRDVPDIWRTSLLVWPFVSYINFGFVPVAWRIAFTSVIGVFWSIYMSVVAIQVK